MKDRCICRKRRTAKRKSRADAVVSVVSVVSFSTETANNSDVLSQKTKKMKINLQKMPRENASLFFK